MTALTAAAVAVALVGGAAAGSTPVAARHGLPTV